MQALRERPSARPLESPKAVKRSVIGCVVRNLTNIGARLEIPPTFDPPEIFNMTFDGGRSIRPCRLAWRTSNEMVVEFL